MLPLFVILGALVSVAAAGSQVRLQGQLPVTITASGFSPRTITVTAGVEVVRWSNQDGVAHTVRRRTGGSGCKLTVAAGSEAVCGSSYGCAGRSTYSVSGFPGETGQIVVVPARRTLTLRASRLTIKTGESVILSGTLAFGSPLPTASGQSITVMSEVGGAPRMLVARVKSSSGRTHEWHLQVRPTATTAYEAEDTEQDGSCIAWRVAKSRRLSVDVRP